MNEVRLPFTMQATVTRGGPPPEPIPDPLPPGWVRIPVALQVNLSDAMADHLLDGGTAWDADDVAGLAVVTNSMRFDFARAQTGDLDPREMRAVVEALAPGQDRAAGKDAFPEPLPAGPAPAPSAPVQARTNRPDSGLSALYAAQGKVDRRDPPAIAAGEIPATDPKKTEPSITSAEGAANGNVVAGAGGANGTHGTTLRGEAPSSGLERTGTVQAYAAADPLGKADSDPVQLFTGGAPVTSIPSAYAVSDKESVDADGLQTISYQFKQTTSPSTLLAVAQSAYDAAGRVENFAADFGYSLRLGFYLGKDKVGNFILSHTGGNLGYGLVEHYKIVKRPPPGSKTYTALNGNKYYVPKDFNLSLIVKQATELRNLWDVEKGLRLFANHAARGRDDIQRDTKNEIFHAAYTPISNYIIGVDFYHAGLSEGELVSWGTKYAEITSLGKRALQTDLALWKQGYEDAEKGYAVSTD